LCPSVFENSKPIGGTQHGIGIMGNSPSNVIKKKANYEGLAIYYKKDGKIVATATG